MWDLCDTPGCAHIATTQPNTFKHWVISVKFSHVGPNSGAVSYFYKHYGEIIFWKSNLPQPHPAPSSWPGTERNTEQLWNEPARTEFQSDTNLDTDTKTDAGNILHRQNSCINKFWVKQCQALAIKLLRFWPAWLSLDLHLTLPLMHDLTLTTLIN